MKACDTPLCENQTVRAALCKWCYERKRSQDPVRRATLKKRMRSYAKRPEVREAHRLACQAYRDAGKVEPGTCVYCGGATNDKRAKRCWRCYRARVLPVASKRGLAAIHGRPV
jgi:hypothetical protein